MTQTDSNSAVRYAVSRWSSPGEWHIETVPKGWKPFDGNPAEVFDTFTEAKAWLVYQTRPWVEGFADDMSAIRALRKADVEAHPAVTLSTSYQLENSNDR